MLSCRNDSRYKNSSRVKESSRLSCSRKVFWFETKNFCTTMFFFNKITKFHCCSVFLFLKRWLSFFLTLKRNSRSFRKTSWFCSLTKLKPTSTQNVKKNLQISKRIVHPSTKKNFPFFFFQVFKILFLGVSEKHCWWNN